MCSRYNCLRHSREASCIGQQVREPWPWLAARCSHTLVCIFFRPAFLQIPWAPEQWKGRTCDADDDYVVAFECHCQPRHLASRVHSSVEYAYHRAQGTIASSGVLAFEKWSFLRSFVEKNLPLRIDVRNEGVSDTNSPCRVYNFTLFSFTLAFICLVTEVVADMGECILVNLEPFVAMDFFASFLDRMWNKTNIFSTLSGNEGVESTF